ncbi:helix-turn-helix domain-containing protein [Corallococcus sp. M34]|uniref:helix-turn-helix domain-containing protein n=1 Tax=Citreicoccus inhibens TaxID=2849499 RepID=UPI001C24BA0D|nr:helix-turn-helix domain-containing protein [Citreicoccus inhibens]
MRQRILDAYLAREESWEEIAKRFQVGVATVDRLIGRWKRTGTIAPRRPGPRPHYRVPDSQLSKVKRLLDAAPDSTTQEIADAYAKATGVRVSRPTMGRAFRRLGYTRKKVVPRLRAAVGEEPPGPQGVFGYGRPTEAHAPPLH